MSNKVTSTIRKIHFDFFIPTRGTPISKKYICIFTQGGCYSERKIARNPAWIKAGGE